MNNQLVLKDVTVKYGAVEAVKNVSLTVNKGDYLCVVGPNGAGKSTLLQAVLGLLPISGGSIDARAVKGKISYLPQSNQTNGDFPASVKEIVLTGRQSKGFKLPFYSEEDVTAAQRAMKQFNISDIASSPINSLSGGQLQRVLLARAMCSNPEMLILDEPTAGLDSEITAELYNMLALLNRGEKVTVIMVIHNMSEAEQYADHIAEIDKTLKFFGTIKQWKERNSVNDA